MISFAARSASSPSDLGQIVDGLLGEILARHDAAARQLERERLVHAFEAQQILGRLRLIDDFLAHDALA